MSGTGTLCLPISKTKKNNIFTDRHNFLVVAAQNKTHGYCRTHAYKIVFQIIQEW